MAIDEKVLSELYAKIGAQEKEDNINYAYYCGKNYYIEHKQIERAPDNRIPVPLAKSAIEDVVGYAARPGDIYLEITPIEEGYEDMYPDVIKAIEKYNNDYLNRTELYEDTLIYGRAAEAVWNNPGVNVAGTTMMMPEFKRVSPVGVYFVYDNSIKKTLLYAVRFYGDQLNSKDYAEVWEPGKIIYWERKGSKDWEKVDEQDLPFDAPGMVKYVSGREESPIFEAQKAIIDAHDDLISKSTNEVSRFNALIMLLPEKLQQEVMDALNEYRVLQGLGGIDADKWPKYLEKNLSNIEGFYNQLADRLNMLFHKTIKVPDMSDEKFAGNATGVAIAFKLLGLEYRAAMIDNYFDRSLKYRLSLINQAIEKADIDADPNAYQVTIKHNRNLPVDLKSKVEIAQILTGIVSRETLLRWMPQEIVEDAERELERLEGEKQSFALIDDEED